MPYGVETELLSASQVTRLLVEFREGQFGDLKAKEIKPAKLSRAISAFANADGGDLYIGIAEVSLDKHREWQGFVDEEAANGHIQALEAIFPLGMDFQYEFLEGEGVPGLVLHVQIAKTQQIIKAQDGNPYVRRGAQSLPMVGEEPLRRLAYAKGVGSFETELVNVSKDSVIDSNILTDFIRDVVPTTTPETWLKKQQLLREEKPTVSCVLLFAEEPQAIIPKHCGIKVYRYSTTESEGTRGTLVFDPITVEGCLYKQIREAVNRTKEIVENIPRLGSSALEAIVYPAEALHEIITNAVLHRDYSVTDDVHVRIFDNRVEVQSPGKLPAHITVLNILDERFARNGAIVRILNKFPDPPNKDVGEGLNTAFAAMHNLGLKAPEIFELENAVLVKIKHERLASPEEAIMEYLSNNPTIKNKQARILTHMTGEQKMKATLRGMVANGLIEQVPGTHHGSTTYRVPLVLTTLEEQDSGR